MGLFSGCGGYGLFVVSLISVGFVGLHGCVCLVFCF